MCEFEAWWGPLQAHDYLQGTATVQLQLYAACGKTGTVARALDL